MKLTPSKALKEIGLLKENGCYIKSTVEYKIVEIALKDYEQLKIVAKPLTDEEKKSINSVARRLKALEIIKRNPSDVLSTLETYDNWETYKEDCEYENVFTFPFNSKEEFDLLKEVLK